MSDTLATGVAGGQATNEIQAAAIAYAKKGLRVVGLHSVDDCGCSCGKLSCRTPGKHPRYDLSPHGALENYAPPEVVSLWRQPYNVGLSLGDYLPARGYYLYACDVDDREIAERLVVGSAIKETACSSTGRGVHIWTASKNLVSNFNPKRADTGKTIGEFRGTGLYVVVPPSRHSTGRTYTWISAPRRPLVVDDPISYLASKVAEAGIELSTQRASVVGVFDGGAVAEYELPGVLERSALRSMRDVRDVLRGSYDGSRDRDRSGKLYWIAQSIKAAAAAHKAPMTVKVLAGIVKRADAMCYRCYNAQTDADHQYLVLAAKVMAD
jgi:hypothetical protein